MTLQLLWGSIMPTPHARFLFLLPLLAACSLYGTPPEGASAQEIVEISRCTSCHGEQLQGGERGPKLDGLQANWDRASLAAFLADPDAAIAQDGRLQMYATMYGSSMPSYEHLSPAQRATLAAWLLERAAR